ncbi:DUF2147 domain-containing protein [Aliiroseovarius sp. KMU-50]|uniref:DUF2147 domain-containing protein n=1 Tax=Aliiroseovarius salicola TaxID=3009082 RepID=A0ABT4W1Y8_9RHOB|nr:DUF2147 domain-containing protein [Aliiroseovarius sp. KMU-50]MDA5093827.1 DUF2147 domain-containing protein [Aliiroseovarius sp. KMU-50]
MKKLMVAAAISFGIAAPALADPVLGTWKTQVDDGHYAHIEMSKCGSEICGVIAKAFDAKGEISSPNVGKNLVWGMKAQGGGSYKKGTIWQPSTGKEYNSKMSLAGDVLKVSGCVLVICKKQTWTRVK